MNVIQKIREARIKQNWVPWILLAICLLAYGIMIRGIGFYWDDWEILFLSRAAETPADIFLFPFRPLHALIDIATVRVLGFDPLPWHVLMLLIRYLGGIVFWLFLKAVWPEHQNRNAWTAALFVVFPAFLHQSMGVIYRQHFTTALLYLLSIWLMVLAYRSWRGGDRKRFWIFLSISLISGSCHLFVTEYFAALELWRPLILLYLMKQDNSNWKKDLGKTALFWLPYFLLVVGYVIWRLVFVAGVIDDPNAAVFLVELRSNPVGALLELVQMGVLDLRYMLGDSWLDIFSEDLLDLSSRVSMLTWAVIVISASGLYFLLGMALDDDRPGDENALGGVFLGAAGLILGLVPAWTIGRHLLTGRYSTRFTIPALTGVSLLVVSIIFYLVSNKQRASIVLAVMLAFAIGRQIQMTDHFRWDWTRQTRTFWQLYWRAPEVEKGTAFAVDKAVSGYSTTYPVANMINLMYAEEYSMFPEYYWFEIYRTGIYSHFAEIQGGQVFEETFHQIYFEVNADNIISLSLPPGAEDTRCVWFLSEDDRDIRLVGNDIRKFATLSNFDRISTSQEENELLTLFGDEPDGGWCRAYQEAELAAQYEDWDLVNQIFTQVQDGGLRSKYAHEFLPYIEGAASVGEWAGAVDITHWAFKVDRGNSAELCRAWYSFDEIQINTEGYQPAFEEVSEWAGCE